MQTKSEMQAAADRYVYGRMSAEESEQFEIAMLRQPQLADEVNLTQQMREGLRRLEDQQRLESLLVQKRAPPGYLVLAAAAAVLVAVVAIGWVAFLSKSRLSDAPVLAASLAALQPGVDARAVTNSLVLTSRRDRTIPTLTLGRATGPVSIRVLPTQAGIRSYRVELHTDGQVATSLGTADVTPDANGFIEVYVDAGRLGAGRYDLQLTAGPAVAESFPFEIAFAP